MLYPQNDDRFVAIDSVTSLDPMYYEQDPTFVKSVIHSTRTGNVIFASCTTPVGHHCRMSS